jgi:uncharacterized repeat protein (TIGR04076 family)
MYKVRATVIGPLGDESRYPCHFNYKKGDEIIWTGAEYKGRICPAILNTLSQKVQALYTAGPRYIEPGYYHAFWYAPPSLYDPSLKKFDGIGFKPVLRTIPDDPFGMSILRPANSFKWPPHPERTVAKNITLICPDLRTSILFKLEAFDLSDDGDSVTYFRRNMCIIDRISSKPGIAIDAILNLFTKEEVEGIYPALSQMLVYCLIDDMAVVGYVNVEEGKVTATEKALKRLAEFKQSLTDEEKEALRM